MARRHGDITHLIARWTNLNHSLHAQEEFSSPGPPPPKQEVTKSRGWSITQLGAVPYTGHGRPVVCGYLFEYSQLSPRQWSFYYPPSMDAIVLRGPAHRLASPSGGRGGRGGKSQRVQAQIGQPSSLSRRCTLILPFSHRLTGGGRPT